MSDMAPTVLAAGFWLLWLSLWLILRQRGSRLDALLERRGLRWVWRGGREYLWFRSDSQWEDLRRQLMLSAFLLAVGSVVAIVLWMKISQPGSRGPFGLG